MEIATRWIRHEGDLFTEKGKSCLSSLSIDAIDDYLDMIEFLSRKTRELDEKVRKKAVRQICTTAQHDTRSGMVCGTSDIERDCGHQQAARS